MIPKVIHYCWFGGNSLPDSAIKCINSWRKFFPEYEIWEWNGNNYDVNKIPYIKEAYEKKKYAFVSDYARFDILYQYGGVYFDTDVEVIKSFDDILESNFMGQEWFDASINLVGEKNLDIVVNPGLGIAASKKMPIYKEILEFYSTRHFILEDGSIDTTTICKYTTDILKRHGYDGMIQQLQKVGEITIYPQEYFCPMNYITGETVLTDNTHSIHWYGATWKSEYDKKISDKRMYYIKRYGDKNGYILFKVATIPDRVKRAIEERGIWGTLLFIHEKVRKRFN